MPDLEKHDYDDFQALLDSYSVHAIGANEPPTLMEIAGIPHWENVYSNILAFLLDTQKARPFFVLLALFASWAAGTMVWSAKHASGRQDPLRAVSASGRGRVLV